MEVKLDTVMKHNEEKVKIIIRFTSLLKVLWPLLLLPELCFESFFFQCEFSGALSVQRYNFQLLKLNINVILCFSKVSLAKTS